MNEIIESKWYISNENELVWFRYYVDDKDRWYCFDDMCKISSIDIRDSHMIFKELSQFSKNVFIDTNADNGRTKPVRYINEFGIKELEQHIIEKFGMIYKEINVLNGQLDKNVFDYEKELMKEFVINAIDNDALIDLKVDESKTDFILDYEFTHCVQPRLKKKTNIKTDEELIVCYKRNKDKKSTCPSWLKEVVK